MAKYSLFQSAFAMCMASNAVSDYDLPPHELKTSLKHYLSGGDFDGTCFPGFFHIYNEDMEGGDWRVVWGPALTTDPTRIKGGDVYARNTMYVAHSPSLSAYVVAVSGTDPKDVYDWIVEDFWVLPGAMVNWPPGDPAVPPGRHPTDRSATEAYISGGTAIGLAALLGMEHDGTSLKGFLETVASRDARLIFTGHSLGGALAPTLALYLHPDPAPARSGWGAVHVLPAAGATPGNQQFATSFNAAYPITPTSDGRHSWNTNYANVHDLIPHAWNDLTGVIWLERLVPPQLTSIFGRIDALLGGSIGGALLAVAGVISFGNYQPINRLKFETAWGYYEFPVVDGYYALIPEWKPFESISEISTLKELEDRVRAAHVNQYERFFDVTPPPNLPLPVEKLLAARRNRSVPPFPHQA